MDPLPLIPEDHASHEVGPSLRRALQDTLDGCTYPKAVAERFVRDPPEGDEHFKDTGTRVLEIHERNQQATAQAHMAAADIMIQNAMYLIEKDKIDNSFELREKLKLARCNLFKKLENEFVAKYKLIQKSDLLPDMIHQYLDFRTHEHTECPACREKVETKEIKQKKNAKIKRSLQSSTETVLNQKQSFQVIPSYVIFHNYKVDEVYKKNVKIINSSPTTQSIALRSLPSHPSFSAIIINNKRLAPGMSVNITITFKPKIYRNLEERLVLKNKEGELVELLLGCTRDLPKLIICIFKSNSNILDRCAPGSNQFVERRREALNSTIDCGSCLVSQYVLASVILENKGMNGKFFFITEDDWFFQNIETVSTSMELFKGDFWIYPTYFEIETEEVVEINIIFQPTKPGLHVEKLYLICDNNALQQIELMGDALEFSSSFVEINVPSNEAQLQRRKDCCIYFGHITNQTTQNLVISVRNKCSLLLTCEWKLGHKSIEGTQRIEESWISQKTYDTKICPYGSIAYEFQIHFLAEKPGYHNIFLSCFITNIPLISLEEYEEFICVDRVEVNDKSLSDATDILITEIELCAMIEFPPKTPSIECVCDQEEKPPKMGFSSGFMKFGILPSGLNIQKEFFVRNDSNVNLNWSILEVKYNIDSSPHIEVIKQSPHLSESSGVCYKRRNQKLFYKIISKKPVSWVSVLVLVSVDSQMVGTIEDICIVVYEIINFDIVIKAKHSKHPSFPVLMPMHLMYRGVPTEIKFAIENRSPIVGYFQFFNPFGEDRDKLLIELSPSSSIIKPLETINLTAKLICSEIGFIENFFVPCFIGLGQEPLILRVLGTTDGPHVVFYLPIEKRRLKKVTWPPKVVYEYDTDPWCSCKYNECLEYEGMDEYFPRNYQNEPFENLMQPTSNVTYTVSDERLQWNAITNKEAGEDTSQTTHGSASTGSTSESKTRKLETIISEEFETDMVLHDDIVEVHDVPVMTPTKVTLFLQNITPLSTKFNLEAQRFVENKKFDHIAVRLHLKKRAELWNDLMGTNYGILVQPENGSGELNPYEFEKLDIWIYANTYGIYSEEIFVELTEMPSYHFSMLIEVVGCPLVLPMGINCITKYPTLRFGTIPFNSPELKREISITNTSSVPINIIWHPFLKYPHDPGFDPRDAFNIFLEMPDEGYSNQVLELTASLNEFYGKATEFCEVEPRQSLINAHSTSYIQVIIRPQLFGIQNKTVDALACLVGHLFLKLEDRKKSNYYLRKTGPDINILKIEATVRLEKPQLQLEIGGAPYIKIVVYANDVLVNKTNEYCEYTVLRNCSESSYSLQLFTEEPFFFKTKSGLVKETTANLTPWGIKELTICCSFEYDQMLALSELVYENGCITDKPPFLKKLDRLGNLCDVDRLEKIVRIGKNMKVIRAESVIRFQMDVVIYFPHISVTPAVVTFPTVLLHTTFKNVITVYNHTGYTTKFEIYKSSGASNFLIMPHHGSIPPSTGPYPSFTNVFIYFCPRECRKYSVSFRVVTNIPNYYIEIPLKGIGSINAKFAIHYKI